jgi:hypothetical protein
LPERHDHLGTLPLRRSAMDYVGFEADYAQTGSDGFNVFSPLR